MERVLASPLPAQAPFMLIFKRWRQQAQAAFGPMPFWVILELIRHPGAPLAHRHRASDPRCGHAVQVESCCGWSKELCCALWPVPPSRHMCRRLVCSLGWGPMMRPSWRRTVQWFLGSP
uniref:Uncharacterized protein n=1 Tax=Arundo donax TaxID=35708 RepID=A0A0A9B7F5_ARUDO